jgi:hypothetical protein
MMMGNWLSKHEEKRKFVKSRKDDEESVSD